MSTKSPPPTRRPPEPSQPNAANPNPDARRGLRTLCAVELCERFAASLFGSLLLLYLNERLGLAVSTATRSIGVFNGAVYLAAVLGGVVTDRWLGTRRAVLIGAALLASGYATLSYGGASLLYASAALLVTGHALFKPSVTAAVGKLYSQDDARRDAAYSQFYVVFNIGAACGPLAGGYLRRHLGWSGAFAVAALELGIALMLGLLGYRWPIERGAGDNRAPHPNSAQAQVWPVAALLGVLGAALLFTTAYDQSSLSLILWARDCTRNTLLGHELPASVWLALPGVLVLAIQPLLSVVIAGWTRRNGEFSPLARMRIGLSFGVLAYLVMTTAAWTHAGSRSPVSPAWLLACFVALTVGELLIYPLSMALVTRLAPPSASTIAMGLFLVSLAGGQWLAGEVAAQWATWPHGWMFMMLAGLTLLALVLLALAHRAIERAISISGR